MGDWDAGDVYGAPVGVGLPRDALQGLTRERAKQIAKDFVRNFRQELVFPYRNQLLQNHNNRTYYLELDLQHLQQYSELLHDAILKRPADIIPMVEDGAQAALRSLISKDEEELELDGAAEDVEAELERERARIPAVQVLLVGDLAATSIRAILADDVNKLVMVPGIVINSSRTKPKAVSIAIRCKNCKAERRITVPSGFGGASIPRTCNALKDGAEGGAVAGGAGAGADAPAGASAKCPLDPFDILSDRCRYVDQQTLKLQEAPESVPTGEMPRHLQLVAERHLADKVSPGTRVSVIGIVSTNNSSAGPGGGAGGGAGGGRGRGGGASVRSAYLRVVGVMVQEEGTGRAVSSFTAEEEGEMRRLARGHAFYDRLAASVAPSISGDYTTDIKKAIMCLLLAGSRKLLPDGVRLRGDINVLMLGDPSTAKSQFLKFVEKVAPVGVYTSGKGSSAAGLTASVIKDARGEFFLEGGAMVLGDGGVVCIDEFDKMREEDRVAIHEAMEQQTISVAKAGITTILNSRAAVLAAANPVFGRYDDTRSAADNIDLLPTILSRFDLIFIVRDVRNEARDAAIARHVMRVHMNADAGLDEAAGEIDMPTMKKFINYARNRCAPRLTVEAADFLRAKYVEIRQEARGRDSDAREARLAQTEEHSVIPITVRQLEALIRITEAVAKCTLCKEASVAHAEEALRLFRVSTLNAAASGLSTLESHMAPDALAAVQRIERRICALIPAGGSQSTARLKEQLLRAGFDEAGVNGALRVMERRDEISLVNERKTVRRNR